MSPRGHQIALRFLADLEDLREHEKNEPAEVEALVSHVVAHLRSWRPESVSPLGTLPAPTEPSADPRTERYPMLHWSDNTSYTDWHSRTHDQLLARARKIGLAVVGAAVTLGWVDRDAATGEVEYTWLSESEASS